MLVEFACVFREESRQEPGEKQTCANVAGSRKPSRYCWFPSNR